MKTGTICKVFMKFPKFMLFILIGSFLFNLFCWLQVVFANQFNFASLFQDDAYYYLLIAENIVNDNGISCDGINPTTGFQPLYQLITIILVYFSNIVHTSVFKCIFFFNLVLVFIASFFIYKALNTYFDKSKKFIIFAVILIFLPLNFSVVLKRLTSGMEMSLGFALLSIATWATLHVKDWVARTISSRRWFMLGLLFGLIPLTRIDLGLFSALFSIYLLVISIHFKKRLPPMFILGCIIPVLCYFAVAFLWFDSIVPVSFLAKQHYIAQWKSSMPLFDRLLLGLKSSFMMWLYPVTYLLFGYYWFAGFYGLAIAGIIIIVLGIIFIKTSYGKLFDKIRSPIVGVLFAALLHSILFGFSGSIYICPASFWYYTPQLLVVVIVFAILIGTGICESTGFVRAVALLLMFVFMASSPLYSFSQDMESYQPLRNAIISVKKFTPESSIIGSWDSGFNAYWLRPRITVNLDGMVNSTDFLHKVVRTGNYNEYFEEKNITYLINIIRANSPCEAAAENNFFHSPNIKRDQYEIIDKTLFMRQNLVIYFVRLHKNQ